MADVSPLIPSGRQLIESYGENRFRVAGLVHTGSIIVLPGKTVPWSASTWAGVTIDSLSAIDPHAADIEVLLLGCGENAQLPSRALRDALREKGIVVEPMNTGAACRTFNVLMAEDRRVAAALVAVE